MLSDISKTFDPLGWLSPVTIFLKQLMQRAWEAKISWDDHLPFELADQYLKWRTKLISLKDVELQRFVLLDGFSDKIELHLFCDASERAYAACIYIVATDSHGRRKSSLLVAKTKVAPVKTQSVPRLELCAALLGTRLYQSVIKSIGQTPVVIEKTFAWTDSTIVLCWLSKEPSRWSTFVSNRISEIQGENKLNWNHVCSEENPADPASRGINPDEINQHDLWWNGPKWLLTGAFPKTLSIVEKSEELKKSTLTTGITSLQTSVAHRDTKKDVIDLSRFNSLYKVLRILAYARRFIDKLKKNVFVLPNYITAPELTESIIILIGQEQMKRYSEEIRTLEIAQQVKPKSQICKLYPFLDNGILCVGGRLVHAKLPEESKFQRLIPQDSHLARLIVLNSHQLTLHGGTSQTIAHIRTRFWIPSCRNLVRKMIMNCVNCNRFNSKPVFPLMGDLPKTRVDPPIKAFEEVGLDFAGPFFCRKSPNSLEKSYLALFVCFASKAVHLELVSDLSTAACIAAIRRFVSRRGCPKNIYSDNGKNFVGSDKEIADLQKILRNEHCDSLQAEAAGLHIKWFFIPPRAPHFGGLWESAIKCANIHLRKVMGNKVLSFEELCTLLCQIEMILNSRPICPLSEDPNNEFFLTPAHFCLGGKLENLPLSQTTDDLKNPDSTHSPTKRWIQIQKMVSHFWKRWVKEYVLSLQEINKRKLETSNLKVGDIVFVIDDNVPPLQWPLAKIQHVYTGPDNVVRVVKIKTATGIYNRPVHKLKKLFDANFNDEFK